MSGHSIIFPHCCTILLEPGSAANLELRTMSISRSSKVIPCIDSHRRITALSPYRALLYFLIAATVFCTSCGGGGSKPATVSSGVDGPVNFLTTGNLNGNDDDPSVAVDPQGNI